MFRGWSQLRKYLTTRPSSKDPSPQDQIRTEVIPLLMSKVDQMILKRQIIHRVVERLVQQAMLNAIGQHLAREEKLYQLRLQEEDTYLQQQRQEIKQHSFDVFVQSAPAVIPPDESSYGSYCSVQ